MVFEKAQKIVEEEVKKRKAEVDKLEYSNLKRDLGRYTGNTRAYIDKLTYYGHKKDKTRYITALRKELGGKGGILEDNKATAEELSTLREKLKTRSEKLQKRMLEQQRAYEELKYRDITKELALNVRKGEFTKAIDKLEGFKGSLSPVSKTDMTSRLLKYNLTESFLRLDLRILEKQTNIKEMQIAYQQVLKKDHVITGISGPNLISGKDGQGNIILATFMVMPDKGLERTSTKKINWLDLYSDIQRNKRGLKKLELRKNPETGKFETNIVDFSVNMPDEIAQDRAKLAEAKLLKKINEIYLMKGLEMLPEAQQKLVKKALKENLNTMGMYFMRFQNKIMPTNEYERSDPLTKQQILMRMITGAEAIIKRMEMERQIETAEDPAMKIFYAAEVAMVNGLHIKAYSHYRRFLQLATGKKLPKFGVDSLYLKISKVRNFAMQQTTSEAYIKGNPAARALRTQSITQALKQMKVASMAMTDTAERYLNAAQEKIAAKHLKHGYAIIKKVRTMLQKGEATDLHDALKKLQRTGFFDKTLYSYTEHTGALEKRTIDHDIGEKAAPRINILKQLASVTEVQNDNGRFRYLLEIAQDTRRTGLAKTAGIKKYGKRLTGSAAVLFKELMREDLIKHRRAVQEHAHGDYWSKISSYRKKIEEELKYGDKAKVLAWKTLGKEAEFKETAERMAVKIVGKDEFKKLPETEQKLLIAKFRNIIVNQRLKAKEQKLLLDAYLKATKGSKNEAAGAYVNMENYFNDWKPWKWSDRTWETIEKEAVLNGMLLAVSGGTANVAKSMISLHGRRALIRLLGKKVGERVAGTLPARLGIGAVAFGGEVVTFESTYRGLRTSLGERGLFELEGKHGLIQGLKHSGRLLGLMHLGSKIVAPVLGKLTPYSGMSAEQLTKFQRVIQRTVPRTLSVTGFEAPLMTWLTMKYDKPQGMSALQVYATAIKDIAFISLGGKMFNSATRNLFPRTMMKFETKSKILDLKGSKNATEVAQGRLLDGMLKKGELAPEQISQLARTQLKPEQIKDLAKFMKDPNNQDFLIALKTAEEGKKMPSAFKEVYESMIKKLKKWGLPAVQAKRFLKNASLRSLLRMKGAMKAGIEKGLELAISKQRVERAKVFVKKYSDKIRTYLKKPGFKKAFILYMAKYRGDFALFKTEHPELARKLNQAKILLTVGALCSGFVGLGMVSALTGISLMTKSTLTMVGILPAIGVALYKPGQKLEIKKGEKYHYNLNGQLVEISIESITNKGTCIIRDNKTNERSEISHSQIKENIRDTAQRIKEMPERQKLADKLSKAGFVDEAMDIASLDKISNSTNEPIGTLGQAKTLTKKLIEFSETCKKLKELGLVKDLSAQLLNREMGTFKERSEIAKSLLSSHEKLSAMQKEIERLAPHLKEDASWLTYYEIKEVNFKNRNKKAEELLSMAYELKGINYTAEQGKQIMKLLNDAKVDNLLHELARLYKEQSPLQKRIRDKLFNIFIKILPKKMAEKLIRREVTKINSALDIIFEAEFIRQEPSFMKRKALAEFWTIYENSIEVKFKQTAEINKIIEKVFQKDPTGTLRDRITKGQRERLIENVLKRLRKDQTEALKLETALKNNDKAYVDNFVRRKIKKYSLGRCNIPHDLKYNLVISTSKTGATVTIYLPEAFYTKMDKARFGGQKKGDWTQMGPEAQAMAIKSNWFGAERGIDNVHFAKIYEGEKITDRRKGTEKHEHEHYLQDVIRTWEPKLYIEKNWYELTKNHSKYMQAHFRQAFLRWANEITARISQGNVDPKRHKDSYSTYYKKDSYKINLEILPEKVRAKYRREFKRLEKALDKSVVEAIETAIEISKYPDGLNLLRATHPRKWKQLLKDVKRTSSKLPETKAVPEQPRIKKSLWGEGPYVNINNFGKRTIQLTLGNQSVLEIRPDKTYGYKIVNAENPSQSIKFADGDYVRLGKENTQGQFTFGDKVSPEHLHITRDGDKITIINTGRTTVINTL